jgi:archaeal flagellar protein FlaF
MENAIVSLICIALMIFGGMTMSQDFLSTMDQTSASLGEIGIRAEDIMRTELLPLSASQPSADLLEVTLRNSGQTKIGDFGKWDVVVQYHDNDSTYHVMWIPYIVGVPGDNEWTKEGIYLDAGSKTAEVFDPGILNPGEEIIIEVKVNPSVAAGTTNLVVISTPNGTQTSTVFAGYTP